MNPTVPALLTRLDYPDPDVIRVHDTYYMISTTMHFLPGGEILRSFDLLHWERVGFVFDELEDTPAHRLEGGQNIYGRGMWAASLRYHRGVYHVCFVANETRKTYLFRSSSITGPWRRTEVAGFYHDCSLLFDEERVFLAWGNTEIRITELSRDLTGPRPGGLDRVVVRETGNRVLGYEGCHFYRIGGRYYLFLIHSLPYRWHRVQACFWAESLESEFRGGDVFDDDLGFGGPGTDGAGIAQGGIVSTPGGEWFAVLFQDRGAVGRIPVLVPVRWEGPLPVFGTEGRVGEFPLPQSTRPSHQYQPLVGSDDFRGALQPHWQWNHKPDPRFWTVSEAKGEFRLTSERTVTEVTQARNTLTQRMLFPWCAVEVTVGGQALHIGDFAGLTVLQAAYGCIALTRTTSGFALVMVHRPLDGQSVVEAARVPVSGPTVRLRVEAHFSATHDEARFFYHELGTWRELGPAHRLGFTLDHFVGCRAGLFLFATKTAGGEAGFTDFRYSGEEADS